VTTFLQQVGRQIQAAREDAREAPLFLFIGAWTLIMIMVPILRWTVGEALFPLDISAGVVSQAVASLAAVRVVWGWRRMLSMAGVIVLCAWGIEYIGHTTGFPFGDYDYTSILQPQIGGVPILVPLAWLMMLPPAWAVANILSQHVTGRVAQRLAFIGWSALAFTAWDLFLDPQMVHWGLWVWNDPGALNYVGIPLSNYAGWLLASVLLTTIASGIAPVRRLPMRPLLLIYAISWFLETFGLIFFWNLPIPGIVGGLVMGGFLLAALRRYAASEGALPTPLADLTSAQRTP